MNMKKSWRTTVSGVLGGLIMLLGQVYSIIDDDPKTNPEYTVIMAAIGMMSLGLNARDETVTSEQANKP